MKNNRVFNTIKVSGKIAIEYADSPIALGVLYDKLFREAKAQLESLGYTIEPITLERSTETNSSFDDMTLVVLLTGWKDE